MSGQFQSDATTALFSWEMNSLVIGFRVIFFVALAACLVYVSNMS